MGSSVYIMVELAIAVLAILGNVLVCWAVWINSNLQNVTNFFVVSLAAADIAVGVLAIPFAITISTGFCAACHGCLFFACFVLVLTQSSIFSLLAIAIDRYIAIRIPLRYNGLVTGMRAKGIIAICWVLSFAIGLTPMLGWNNCSQKDENSTKTCGEGRVTCLFEDVVPMNYMVYYNFFAFVLLPLLLMLAIYLRIFLAARRQLKQMESQPLPGERTRSTLQTFRKIIRTHVLRRQEPFRAGGSSAWALAAHSTEGEQVSLRLNGHPLGVWANGSAPHSGRRPNGYTLGPGGGGSTQGSPGDVELLTQEHQEGQEHPGLGDHLAQGRVGTASWSSEFAPS